MAAKKRRESRLSHGLMQLTVGGKTPYWNPKRCRERGLCKAGHLCFKADNNGKPAPSAEGNEFCNENCRESYPIRRKMLETNRAV